MSDIHTEIAAGHGEPLSRAAQRFPPYRQGKSVTLSCLVRWVLNGVRAPNGERIKLEAARLAGRWITTPQAISRFVAAQSPPSTTTTPTSVPRSPSARQRSSERAAKLLEAAGI